MSFTQRSIVSELNQDTKQFSTVVYGSCDSVYLKLLLVTLSNKDQVGGETILSPKSKKPATLYTLTTTQKCKNLHTDTIFYSEMRTHL